MASIRSYNAQVSVADDNCAQEERNLRMATLTTRRTTNKKMLGKVARGGVCDRYIIYSLKFTLKQPLEPVPDKHAPT